jgi:hypothetical protein
MLAVKMLITLKYNPFLICVHETTLLQPWHWIKQLSLLEP